MVQQEGLIHGSGVVVQAPGNGQVHGEVLLRHAEGGQVRRHHLQLLKARVEDVIPPGVRFQSGNHLGVGAPDGNEGKNLLRLRIQ